MKYKKLGSAVLLGLLVTIPAFAEESSVSSVRASSDTSINTRININKNKIDGGMDRAGNPDQLNGDRSEPAMRPLKGEIKDLRADIQNDKRDMRDSYRESTAEEKAQMKASIEARKAAFKIEIQAMKKENLAARKEFAVKRFNNAVSVIESKQVRVTTLLEKMKANGKDTASAEASLKVSIDKLAIAKTSLAAFVTLFATAEKDSGALRASAKKVEEDLKASRDALLKALSMVENNSVNTEVKTNTSVETSASKQ